MNCKPGDLARIVGLSPALSMAMDKIVLITNDPPEMLDGEPTWRLTKRVDLVMQANGSRNGVNFYIGDSVWFDQLQDKYLRPIRDPGGDAQDQTLSWKPVPLPEIVPALLDREVAHG